MMMMLKKSQVKKNINMKKKKLNNEMWERGMNDIEIEEENEEDENLSFLSFFTISLNENFFHIHNSPFSSFSLLFLFFFNSLSSSPLLPSLSHSLQPFSHTFPSAFSFNSPSSPSLSSFFFH
jgi:hypothetical protein